LRGRSLSSLICGPKPSIWHPADRLKSHAVHDADLDEHANDLVHRQTMLVTRDADSAAQRLYSEKIQFVSSGAIVNQNGQLGFSKACVVRDPDGHAVEIEQK